MKVNRSRIEKRVKILERIRYNGLKIPKVIDAIKRFVLPRLDYPMMNSVMGVTELSELDKFVRNIINELVGRSALSKDIFYTANKNGRFGLRLLTER
jgi:RIO-like serine/threonine protein kinase